MGVIFAAVFVWMGLTVFRTDALAMWLMIIMGLIPLLIGVCFGIAILGIRLTLSPSGVIYRPLGYTIEAPWSQVRLDDTERGSKLAIQRPTVHSASWLQFLLRLQVPILGLGLLTGHVRRPVRLDDEWHTIPLTAFGADLPSSTLRADLQHYAPDLVSTPSPS
jgi:hypothetical protein